MLQISPSRRGSLPRLILSLTVAALVMEQTTALVALKAGWAAYKTLLTEKPVLTKSLTSGAIMGLSDAVTQRLERRFRQQDSSTAAAGSSAAAIVATPVPSHDWLRTFHTMATGFIWSGPSAHIWYASLERICSLMPVESQIGGIAQRLFFDALIFSPVTVAGYFVVSTMIQKGALLGPGRMREAVDDIRVKMSTKWAKAVVGAWSFWPPVNVFNFSLVPLKFRVLYANVMSLLWTGYLSFLNYQKKKAKPAPKTE